MKKLLFVLLLVLLCASVSEAYVYRQIGAKPVMRLTGASIAIANLAEEKSGLGSVDVTVHPFIVSAPPASSVRPGQDVVLKIKAKKNAANSPMITEEETASNEGVTILVTESNSAGDIQLYATSNVEGNILPSSVIRFDANPDVYAWTVNANANSGMNTQINYVVLIKYKDGTKIVRKTINVR